MSNGHIDIIPKLMSKAVPFYYTHIYIALKFSRHQL